MRRHMAGIAALSMICGSNATRDAKPKVTVPIDFPQSLVGGPRDNVVCRTIVEVGPEGEPREVQHEDCAAEVAQTINEGLMQWRWGTFDGRGMAPITVGLQEPKEKYASTAPPVAADWDEYRFKKWVDPPFMMVPKSEWGERFTYCEVNMAIASNGVPVSVAVSNCNIAIQVELANSLLKCRWPSHEHVGSYQWIQTSLRAPFSIAKF